ncbi:MAG: hypothetical protein IJ506_02045 [Clostridia bacterium]|nr:hypothetical protein [Clostridia bacterium]
MLAYKVIASTNYGVCRYNQETVMFQADKDYEEAFWDIEVSFEKWEEDCYIFAPACVYNGNRYKKAVRPLGALMYYKSDMGKNAENLGAKSIPGLNKDGSGKIEVTAGDMATPCVGIFFKKAQKAFFVFTEQEIKGKNLGFCIRERNIQIQYPCNRESVYVCSYAQKETGEYWTKDFGVAVKKDEAISSKLLICTYDCKDLSAFYEIFFNIRKILMRDERAQNLYTDELLKIMENHFNEYNWSGQYYGTANKKQWQAGWCGPVASSYALYKLGDETTKARAIKTMDWLTSHIAPTSFFYGMIYDGVIEDDSFYQIQKRNGKADEGYLAMKDAHFIRKSGDVLLFLYKHFEVMPVKEKWVQSAKGCADAFVRLFEKYGTFGQFVNIETGEMQIGLSCAGASAIGGLVKSWEYFNNPVYLDVAKKAGDFYYENFISKGITCGGAGDILTVADSESSYGFVESYVLLYEATKEEKWLQYAKESVHLFSSWVMTYAYKFPEGCEFDRLKVNTVGSVFANVQNKHSAPGICTYSGDTLYRLYQHTGETEYLELIKDIVFFIPQCVSMPNRPIYDWYHKYGEIEGRLPNGRICERVNTSDWETQRYVGGVFNVGCWCETSLILTFAELKELVNN